MPAPPKSVASFGVVASFDAGEPVAARGRAEGPPAPPPPPARRPRPHVPLPEPEDPLDRPADGAAPPDGLPGYALGLLLDRFTAALEAGVVVVVGDAVPGPGPRPVPAIGWDALRALVQVLFPEECVHDRPPPQGCSDAPPGSEDRIAAYAARFARGEDLYHAADADPAADDRRVVAGGKRANGSNAFVAGWAAGVAGG